MAYVMVVDDDPAFVEACTLMLRHEGYEVTTADSVSSARDRLADAVPQAMLLDWKLPDGTALDVLRWLSHQPCHIPTALLTGFWSDQDFASRLTDAKTLGVCGCIRRGIDLEDPATVVSRLLSPVVTLHCRVLRGDDMARELVTSQLLDTLVPRLRGRFRAARADAITDAVADAILQYLRDPHGFDAVRHRSLEGFIWMLARRNLCNTIRADRRATTRDVEYARQLSTLVTAHDGCQSSDYIAVIDDAVRQEPDTRIRLALRGWLGDQNATALWLAVPLIAALAKADRAVEIKRQKDRFIARLKRVKKRLSAARKRIDEVEMARSGGGDTDRAAEGRNSDSERAQNE